MMCRIELGSMLDKFHVNYQTLISPDLVKKLRLKV